MELLEYFLENFCIDDMSLDEESIEKYIRVNKEKIIKDSEKITIGASIMVKNQEELIVSSIQSALMISDSIDIFDTGSTDKTKENIKKLLSKNNKIKLMEIDWIENFSKMRDLVFKNNNYRWVFTIDSDEVLICTPKVELLKQSLALLENIFSEKDISIKFLQEGGETQVQCWVDRLLKKSNTLHYFGVVHEEPRSSREMISIRSQFKLFNHGRKEEQKKIFNKEKRYFSLLQENILNEPDNMKWIALLPFEEAMKNLVWYEPLITKYSKKILKIENFSSYSSEQIFLMETTILSYIKYLISTKNLKEAKAISNNALNIFPGNTSILLIHILIENQLLVNRARESLKDIKMKYESAKANKAQIDGKWDYYNSFDGIEELVKQIIIKAELD